MADETHAFAMDSEGALKAEDRRASERREEELNDLRAVLNSPHGKRFLWRLLEHARLYSTSVADEHTTFRNEGRREYGLWLLAEISAADPLAYPNLMLEQGAENV